MTRTFARLIWFPPAALFHKTERGGGGGSSALRSACRSWAGTRREVEKGRGEGGERHRTTTPNGKRGGGVYTKRGLRSAYEVVFVIFIKYLYENMTPLKLHGSVRMRSIQTGTTKWKEGTFEIVDKDSKVILVVHYNAGGIPKIFP
ncbi:putative Ubiquitin carboxyl-terminal hydrolase 37-like protein, partial [Naja naja]